MVHLKNLQIMAIFGPTIVFEITHKHFWITRINVYKDISYNRLKHCIPLSSENDCPNKYFFYLVVVFSMLHTCLQHKTTTFYTMFTGCINKSLSWFLVRIGVINDHTLAYSKCWFQNWHTFLPRTQHIPVHMMISFWNQIGRCKKTLTRARRSNQNYNLLQK